MCMPVLLKAFESAWEAARGQNKSALHKLKKRYASRVFSVTCGPSCRLLTVSGGVVWVYQRRESLSKELESAKTESQASLELDEARQQLRVN